MADLSYDSYLKNKDKTTKKSSSLSYDSYLKSKQPKESLGTKALDFTKAIVSPVATMVARPIQLGAELAGVSDEKVNEITNKTKGWIAPTPQSGSDVLKDVGRGVQTAALGLTGGGSTLGKMALTGAKEGAIFGAGYALEKEGTKAFSKEGLKEAIKSAAIGAVLNPVVGTVLNKVASKLGGKTTKVIEKEVNPTIKNIDDIADNSLSKSKVGLKDKTVTYLKENPQEIANREVRLREVDGKVVIEDGRHTLQAAKETGITPLFKDVTPEYTGKKSTIIDDIINKKEVVQPEITTQTPIKQELFKPEKLKKIENRFIEEDPTFNTGSLKTYTEEASKLSREELIDVALGRKQAPTNLPSTAALKFARELPDLQPAEAKRLLSTFVKSKSGAELQAAKLTKGDVFDNPVDFMEAYNTKMKANAQTKVVTNKTANRFLDELECK